MDENKIKKSVKYQEEKSKEKFTYFFELHSRYKKTNMMEKLENKTNLIKNINIIFVLPVLLTVIFQLSEITSSVLFQYIGVLLIALCLFLYTDEAIFYIIIFFVPNQRIFVFKGGDFSLLAFFILFAFIRFVLNYKYKYYCNPIFLFLTMLFVIYNFFHLFINNSFYDIVTAIKFPIVLFYIIGILDRFKNKIWLVYKRSIYSYVIGCLTMIIVGLINVKLMSKYWLFERFAGGYNNDPNYYAVSTILAISFLIILILNNIDLKRNIILFVFFTIFGLMSLSRTFIIAYCINIAFLFFNSIFAKKFKYKKYSILLIVIVVVLIIMPNSFLNNIESRNINRFLNARDNDISGGRIDILKDYTNILYNNPQIMFFGVGKENYYKKLNVSQVAHNAIIGTIVTSGILGLLLIFLLFDFIFIKIKRIFQNKNIKFINYLPMLSLFFGYSTLDGLTSSLFTFGFFLSAICIHSKSNKKI